MAAAVTGMTKKQSSSHSPRAIDPGTAATDASADTYRVGPGRPPREYQFKPGQSGNPKGARRRQRPLQNIKKLIEQELNEEVVVTQGNTSRRLSKRQLGIKRLVAGFANGDRAARRDLFALAAKYDVDLVGEQGSALAQTLQPDHQALLDSYVQRRTSEKTLSAQIPTLAPPDLTDDDKDGPAT